MREFDTYLKMKRTSQQAKLDYFLQKRQTTMRYEISFYRLPVCGLLRLCSFDSSIAHTSSTVVGFEGAGIGLDLG